MNQEIDSTSERQIGVMAAAPGAGYVPVFNGVYKQLETVQPANAGTVMGDLEQALKHALQRKNLSPGTRDALADACAITRMYEPGPAGEAMVGYVRELLQPYTLGAPPP